MSRPNVLPEDNDDRNQVSHCEDNGSCKPAHHSNSDRRSDSQLSNQGGSSLVEDVNQDVNLSAVQSILNDAAGSSASFNRFSRPPGDYQSHVICVDSSGPGC